jgi:hypothetical protein
MSGDKKPIEVDINGNPLNGHSKPTSVDDVIIYLSKPSPIGETVLTKQEISREYANWRNNETALRDLGKDAKWNYDEWIAIAQDAHTRKLLPDELRAQGWKSPEEVAAREAYYKKLSDELVEHTRKDERQQEAEWLTELLRHLVTLTFPPDNLIKVVKKRIAYLRGNCQEKADSWPGIPDGEGCKEK